jgi:DUF4097 and DUF4098 domain-containing protein YvlB
MKFRAAVPALLALGLVSGGCVVHVDTQAQIVREEKRFRVSGVPDLQLVTFDGSIEIRAWDKPEVLVEVEKRGATKEAVEALQVVATQDGGRIELEVKRPRSESFSGIGFHRGASANLIVSVPSRVDLRARTGDGSIKVERITGKLELRTGDGSISASEIAGEALLNTGDGSITVAGAQGALDIDTGDGGVNVSGRIDRLKVHTGDGSVVFRGEPDLRMAGNWEISTGDGSVTLYLPSNFDAVVDAHTGDGAVRCELDVSGDDQLERDGNEKGNRRSLKGRLGAGGNNLRIRSGDGTIRLRVS